MPDLTSYDSITVHTFVSIVDLDSTTHGYSDYNQSYTIGSVTYSSLGTLLDITSMSNEVHVSENQLTVTMSAIDATLLGVVQSKKIKGAEIIIKQVFFDAAGVELVLSDNPTTKFRGYVDHYGINETYDNNSRSSTFNLTLICASKIDLFFKRLTGRQTNPDSQAKFYPSDTSMDNMPNIVHSNFNFGAGN